MTLPTIVQRLRTIAALNNQISEISVGESLLSPFTDVIPAPLVDHAGNTETPVNVSNYSATASAPILGTNTIKIPVTITCDGLCTHTNGAGTRGYWIGLGVLQKSYNSYTSQASAAWSTAPNFTSTWQAVSAVRDNMVMIDDKVYDTFYFGYDPNAPERKGYVSYRYENYGNVIYIVYEITFNVNI